jgi:hypothetical protein
LGGNKTPVVVYQNQQGQKEKEDMKTGEMRLRRRIRFPLVVALVLASVATALPGCSPPQPFTVNLATQPSLDGRSLVIAGTTDLPDGARLSYEVGHGDSWQKTSGTVACSNGRYRATQDLADWPAGTVTVIVTFYPGLSGQPEDLRKRCGDNGRYLTGPRVVEIGGAKVAQVSARVILAARPQPTAPTTGLTQPSGTTVYITKSGAKYHRAGCRYLAKSSIPISLQDAKARGYGPCSVCKPPA